MTGTNGHRTSATNHARSRVVGLLLSVVGLLAATGCTSGATAAQNDLVLDQIAADVTATANAPTATAIAPTATAEPTATPEPSRDPRFDEAEAIAVEYFSEVIEVFGDARNGDLTRMIELEAPGSPLEDYALRITAEMLQKNRYLPAENVTMGLVEGSTRNEEWRGEQVIAVHICHQTGGLWRDFDTDEIVLRSLTEPGETVVRVTSSGPVLVSSMTELMTTCEFSGQA